MAIFATVDNTNLQSEDMGNEIILSYSEHRQILGQSAVDAVITGDDMQDKTLWLAMQAWLELESNCVRFVNHNSPPDMFTLATWRAAAGLNAAGFSRYVENVLTGYGNIAKGYDRSIVNFQELQKGLDALRWTKATVTWTAKGENSGWQGSSTDFPTWAEAKADAVANWGVAGPTNYPCAATNGAFGAQYQANGVRSYAYAQASGIVTVIQHSAELWMNPKAWAYGNPPNLIFDANGDIIGNAGVWGLEFSLAEAATATREQVVGSVAGFPAWCDEPNGGHTGRGWRNDEDTWILKWNGANGFSYTL